MDLYTMNFKSFSSRIHDRFDEISEYELFETNTDQSMTIYLGAFPDGTDPIHIVNTKHNCSCCRNFIRHLGGVVAIVDNKILTVWDIFEELEYPYNIVAEAMHRHVLSNPILGVFRAREPRYGAETTKQKVIGNSDIIWNHFHGEVSRRHTVKYGTDKGECNTTITMLQRAMEELTLDAVQIVHEMIVNNSLKRGHEFLEFVSRFRELLTNYHNCAPEYRQLFILQNYTNPRARFRNSSIGKLVADLSDGVPLESAIAAYNFKVDPTNYYRSTAPVSQTMAKSALKVIVDLGLEPSLKRRLATIHDINVNDVIWVDNTVRSLMKGGIESLLEASVTNKKVNIKNPQDISIGDFMSAVLPKTRQLDLLLTNHQRNHIMAITAPVYEDSPLLFKWDNPFAWSYHGNTTDSIIERVKAAGGNINGELCCRLAWDYKDDLDFEMRESSNYLIYFSNRRTRSPAGGMLDVDANGLDNEMEFPVENIYYERIRTMPAGKYILSVHNFSVKSSNGKGFQVEIDVKGTRYFMEYEQKLKQKQRIEVAYINKLKDGDIQVETLLPTSTSPRNICGVTTEQLTKVKTVVYSPNYWGSNKVGNKHYFFILEGCKMTEPVRGIYNEYLRSDLLPHRKVFESLGEQTKCPVTEDQLSGIGFSSTLKGESVVVVSDNRPYKIIF